MYWSNDMGNGSITKWTNDVYKFYWTDTLDNVHNKRHITWTLSDDNHMSRTHGPDTKKVDTHRDTVFHLIYLRPLPNINTSPRSAITFDPIGIQNIIQGCYSVCSISEEG